MRRDELLVRVNRRAKSRYGLSSPKGPPITDGMLGDWLEAKIIEAPPKHGGRNWTGRHYRRAMEIVRLKSQGVQSLPLVRAIFFIKDMPGIPLPDAESRNALATAYVKLKNELVGHIHSTYPLGNADKDSAWRKRAVLNKMGALDPSLAELIQYKPHELLSAYASARFDRQKPGIDDAACRIMQGLVAASFQKMCPETPPPILRRIENVSAILGGNLGQRTEIETPDQSVCRVSEQHFYSARTAFNQQVAQLRCCGNEEVARTLTLRWQWRVWTFVLLLDLIHRQRSKGIIFEFEFAGKLHKISGLGVPI